MSAAIVSAAGPTLTWVLGYLANSLWQVPLLFAAGWMAARLVRRAGEGLEHRVWVGALVMEAVLPGCSLHVMALVREVWGLLPWGHGATGGEVRVAMGAGAAGAGVLRLPAMVLVSIAVAYAASVLYFAGRLAWGVGRTTLLERRAKRVVRVGEDARQWARYCALLGVKRAEVAVSASVSGPVTAGLWKGVMLVPPGFLEDVATDDLKAVVAHELAHMRRRDFAKNLLYGLLTLPVAYHPMSWMTRSRVAESREMVCDAMAAEVVAGRERYARSLLRLASLLAGVAPVRTLHAIGIFDANIFERRIMKLTEKRREISGARRLVMAAACVMVALATCGSALALRMDVAAPMAQDGGAALMTVPAEEMAKNVVYKKTPVYPAEAKAKKDIVNGPVVLHVVIGKDGAVEQIQVEKSLREEYDRSALDAVREWKYKPYLMNGQPVAVNTTVTVTYSVLE